MIDINLNKVCKSYGFDKILNNIDLNINKGEKVDEETIVSQLGLPLFVKPNGGGSSYGTSKVKEATQLSQAVNAALVEGDQVIIESFMKGIEITCGVYKTQKKSVVFPTTEVVSKNEFFDITTFNTFTHIIKNTC